MILVNTDSQNAASFQLKFWDESGNPLTLPLGPDGTASSVSGSIPAGSSRIVQTQGLSTTSTSVGWAQLSAPATVGGTSIFTYNNATEASVALTANGAQQLYIPFDNTTGFSTGLALANPAMQNALVSVTMFDDSGNKLTTAQVTVPATGHWANNVDHQIAASGINGVIDSRRPRGHRGVMQLSSNVPVYSIGIRGRTGTPYLFTSLDALHGVPAGNKTIAHLANGGGWATTIELINTDAVAAPFTLNFYDGGGNPLMLAPVNQGPATSVSGTIQPGQIRIVQTDGSGMFNQGSAQLITQNALGGTCIFTENGVSEAAVSIASAGGKTLYIPYDNTGPFLTGIALANPGSSAAPLTKVTFTDSDTGNTIQPTLSQSLIQPNGHYTANVSDYIGAPSRGLIRVDSNVDLFGVAIRLRMAASGAVTYYFTALPVLPVNP